jgi:Aminoglycoside-2''-adenylyltransferase
MQGNTLTFLLESTNRFTAAALPLWVFGGWAEELWQITPARVHRDIDFLYSAATFEQLDFFMAQMNDLQEIQPKRYSHKRAIMYQNVMIEFLLVQHAHETYFTDFFSGRYHLVWPTDVFFHSMNVAGANIQIASKHALTFYREHHKDIEQTYQDLLAAC